MSRSDSQAVRDPAGRGEEFVQSLAAHLSTVPLPRGLTTELELEQWIGIAVRSFTAKALHVPARKLDRVVYQHGDTRESKALWTESKRFQNVVVFGCSNTSDIFIRHAEIGTVYIELKLSKARGEKSNSLPGDLQRSIGQSVIASLRHDHIVCLVVTQGKRRSKDHDLGEDLRRSLWEKHRIALVVREARLS